MSVKATTSHNSKKKYRRTELLFKIVLILLTLLSLQADDINSLIQDYVKASELSNKTKNENAGNLIVYTRDDLERMQALTLKDLLKSLRYFSYSESRRAQSDLLNFDSYSNNSKGIRLYLNNHELSSPLHGSGFIYFGDMELEFIDHVEIYTGFPSFEFGVEPATVVIRLYTKDATHDEGGKVKLMGSDNSSSVLSTYYTDSFEDFNYFAYLGDYSNNRDAYDYKGGTLGRDQHRTRFYGSLANENHSVELHAVQSKNDAFMGTFENAQVKENDLEYSCISVSTHSKFLDDSLTFDFSYVNIDSVYDQNFNLPDLNITDLTANNKVKEEGLTLRLQKKWNLSDNEVTVGLQYRYKYFDITERTFNDKPLDGFTQAYDSENIFSLYLQDLYSINENNILSLSLMNQFYQRNGDVNAPNNLQLRLGYNYTVEKFSAKTTLSAQSFAAEPYTLISAGQSNVNLKSESYYSFAQELTFKSYNTINNFIFTYANLQDYPIPGRQDPNGTNIKPRNSEKSLDIITSSYEFTYYYSQKDKFEFNLNYSSSDSVYNNDPAQLVSSLLRSLNTFGKLDVLNELWVVVPAYGGDSSFDYTLGLKYRTTKDFSAQIKAVNVFDNGEKRTYIDGSTRIDTSIYDRKLWIGMEYLF